MAELDFKRLFTPEEARRTLPLVRRIVSDILNAAADARRLSGEKRDLSGIVGTLEEHFAELAEIGCFYKDWNFSVGLVDFPSEIDGEVVFLCWRTDEPDILWYHRIEEGYAGRKLLPVDDRSD